jgi:hypothetical protein
MKKNLLQKTVLTLSSAFQMLKRAHKPFTKIDGDILTIAQKIISDCYKKAKINNEQFKYFVVSNGHFAQFYCRDFGMCVTSLVKLGYTKECQETLKYALTIFQNTHKITTTIDHNHNPIDYFAPGPDSLAFLLHAIKTCHYNLSDEEREFLNDQICLYYAQFWDMRKNTPKRKTYFSSAKDHYIRDASCYDFTMIAWTSKLAKQLNLHNPFSLNEVDFENRLVQLYWNGEYFFDDLTHEEYVASDAQIFPFFCEICTDSKKWHKANKAIINEELNLPFPIQYTAKRYKKKERFEAIFAPNYEGNTVWIHIGLCYVIVLAKFDKEQMQNELEKLKNLIYKHKNLLEVFYKNAKPYKTIFYKADENLLWISIIADLQKDNFVRKNKMI